MYYNIKITSNGSEFALDSNNREIITREMDLYFAWLFEASEEFKSNIKEVEIKNPDVVSINDIELKISQENIEKISKQVEKPAPDSFKDYVRETTSFSCDIDNNVNNISALQNFNSETQELSFETEIIEEKFHTEQDSLEQDIVEQTVCEITEEEIIQDTIEPLQEEVCEESCEEEIKDDVVLQKDNNQPFDLANKNPEEKTDKIENKVDILTFTNDNDKSQDKIQETTNIDNKIELIETKIIEQYPVEEKNNPQDFEKIILKNNSEENIVNLKEINEESQENDSQIVSIRNSVNEEECNKEVEELLNMLKGEIGALDLSQEDNKFDETQKETDNEEIINNKEKENINEYLINTSIAQEKKTQRSIADIMYEVNQVIAKEELENSAKMNVNTDFIDDLDEKNNVIQNKIDNINDLVRIKDDKIVIPEKNNPLENKNNLEVDSEKEISNNPNTNEISELSNNISDSIKKDDSEEELKKHLEKTVEDVIEKVEKQTEMQSDNQIENINEERNESLNKLIQTMTFSDFLSIFDYNSLEEQFLICAYYFKYALNQKVFTMKALNSKLYNAVRTIADLSIVENLLSKGYIESIEIDGFKNYTISLEGEKYFKSIKKF